MQLLILLFLFFLVFYLLRKGMINFDLTALLLFSILIVFIFGTSKSVVSFLSVLFSIHHPPIVIILITLILMFLIIVILSVFITKIRKNQLLLTQRIAELELKLKYPQICD